MTLLAAASVVLRLAGCVPGTLVLGSRLVGVSPQAVVELALWSVLRTVHPGVVETAIAARDLAVLAVGVVEVGHAPAVLLILVVVSISRPMLGRCNGLGIRCWSTVVEVDLGPVDTIGTWPRLRFPRPLRTQIIQMRRTSTMMKSTAPAMPPAMYANSDFSSQFLPLKDPAHWQYGFPS